MVAWLLQPRVLACVLLGIVLSWACTYKYFIDIPETVIKATQEGEDATPLVERLWERLLDFEKYKKWSPYIHSVKVHSPTPSSALPFQAGMKITLRFVGDNDERSLVRDAKVIHYEDLGDKKKMCWEYEQSLSRFYLLQELDCLSVEALDEWEWKEREREKLAKRKRREREAERKRKGKGKRNRRYADDQEEEEEEFPELMDYEEMEDGRKRDHDVRKRKKDSDRSGRGERVRVRMWKWYTGPLSLYRSYATKEAEVARLQVFQKALSQYLSRDE